MEEHRKALARAVRRERQRRKEGEGEVKLARALVKGRMLRNAESEYNDVVKAWVTDIRCICLAAQRAGKVRTRTC